MKQFKITYRYQDFRTVQTNYSFVSAADQSSAKAAFMKNWVSQNPVEIVKIVQVGV